MDFRDIYIARYKAYRSAGADEDAAQVAKVLRTRYGHEVEQADDPQTGDAPAADDPASPEGPAKPPRRRKPGGED